MPSFLFAQSFSFHCLVKFTCNLCVIEGFVCCLSLCEAVANKIFNVLVLHSTCAYDNKRDLAGLDKLLLCPVSGPSQCQDQDADLLGILRMSEQK